MDGYCFACCEERLRITQNMLWRLEADDLYIGRYYICNDYKNIKLAERDEYRDAFLSSDNHCKEQLFKFERVDQDYYSISCFNRDKGFLKPLGSFAALQPYDDDKSLWKLTPRFTVAVSWKVVWSCDNRYVF